MWRCVHAANKDVSLSTFRLRNTFTFRNEAPSVDRDATGGEKDSQPRVHLTSPAPAPAPLILRVLAALLSAFPSVAIGLESTRRCFDQAATQTQTQSDQVQELGCVPCPLCCLSYVRVSIFGNPLYGASWLCMLLWFGQPGTCLVRHSALLLVCNTALKAYWRRVPPFAATQGRETGGETLPCDRQKQTLFLRTDPI